MAVPNVSPNPGSAAHMEQLDKTRKRPTAKEEGFEILKSIGQVALGAIICVIAIVSFPISIPIIGWRLYKEDKENVAKKVQDAAQQALTQSIEAQQTVKTPISEPKPLMPAPLMPRPSTSTTQEPLKPISPEKASVLAINTFKKTVEKDVMELKKLPNHKTLFVRFLSYPNKMSFNTRKTYLWTEPGFLSPEERVIDLMFTLNEEIEKISDDMIASLTPHIEMLSSIIKDEIDNNPSIEDKTQYRREIKRKFAKLGTAFNID